VFISDLHLGLGRTEQDQKGAWVVGAWHPMEDFRWQQQFDAFLSNLEGRAKRTGVPIDLIILGDFLELWQTPWPPSDCIYNKQGKAISPAKAKNTDVQKDWSCSEADALKRLQRVLGAHTTTLTHLKRFAESGDNRLTIVIGNHDAALIYPRIAAATLAAIGSSPERVRIASEGYWHSADGQIFAEHGHFLENDVNIYDVLPASCLALNNRQASCGQQGVFLRRPWGEQFVQRYYNKFEETYQVIDNMTSEWYGVKLAVAEAGASEAQAAVRDGFRFLLLHESPSQLVSLLGESDRTLGGGRGAGWLGH
jgi:UDP-2,3-diacylglucosamine pyrophosphatase LpxH